MLFTNQEGEEGAFRGGREGAEGRGILREVGTGGLREGVGQGGREDWTSEEGAGAWAWKWEGPVGHHGD